MLTLLILSPLAAKNRNFAVFGLRHFVVSPVGGNLRKLNGGAQLQTFPYPTTSQKFCTLTRNAFMAKSVAQTDVQKRDEQTSTNKKNLTFLASPAADEIRAPPNVAR